MNLKRILFCPFLFCVVFGSTVSGASNFYINASALHFDISGEPAMDLLGSPKVSNTSKQYVPRFSVGYFLTESWALELSYTHLGTIKSNGVSPVGNPVPPGGAIFVITPYEVTEKIYAPAISMIYNLEISESITFKVGPNLTYFRNKLSVKGESVLFLKETREDFKIGADLSLDYRITDSFSVALNYHYLNPPKKDIRLFGISAVLRF